jgi:hypothetical protein
MMMKYLKQFELLGEFLDYMRKNASSEHYQNNNLNVMIGFGNFLGSEKSFRDGETKSKF